ncbi:MAG: Nif11-like leader peptide family natural product precursor [Synechococcus sp.]|nr:Nif11-like leader peptide family natural product precursor [Synechococcus sp.]
MAALRHSPEMRRLLAEVRTPGEIVAIANQCGYTFTVKDLQRASSDLAADHWAWGGKDRAWKQAFFASPHATPVGRGA